MKGLYIMWMQTESRLYGCLVLHVDILTSTNIHDEIICVTKWLMREGALKSHDKKFKEKNIFLFFINVLKRTNYQ